MPLTTAQLQALKADIAANTNTIPAGQTWTNSFAGQQVKDIPNTGDGNATVAGWYDQIANPAYLVWRTDTQISAIRAAINLAVYTPSDAVPASGSTVQITNDQLQYQGRAFICQLKQSNALFLIQGQTAVDCTPANLRQSFSDCLRQIPSGGGGANNDAGWGAAATPQAVRLAMQRTCKFIEKLFVIVATGAGNDGIPGNRGTNTNPDALVFEGLITGSDVEAARNS